MKLKKLNYSQLRNTNREWILKDCTFEKFNLLVGKNASGKSRTLNVIYNLAQSIIGRRNHLQDSQCDFCLENDKENIIYSVSINQDSIESETYSVNNEVKLERYEDGKGEIFAEELNKKIKFHVPNNVYSVVAKRDKLQHQFLESLIQWAENVKIFHFGSELGKNELVIEMANQSQGISPSFSNHFVKPFSIIYYFEKGLKLFGEQFKKDIISDMMLIGFPILELEVSSPISMNLISNIPGNPKCLVFKEESVKSNMDQFEMSQGMFRTFSLIVYSNYLKFQELESTLLIDDIGEGLDYERSVSLIKRIIEISKASKFQVILTSNDRYVMNSVDLNHWSIILRDKQKVTYKNYQNSKEKFDDFIQLGLSNFDFFAGEFIK